MTFKEQLLLAVAPWKSWQRYLATILLLFVLIAIWWFASFKTIWTSWHAVAAPQDTCVVGDEIASLPASAQPESIATVFAKRSEAFFAFTTVPQVTTFIFSRCAAEPIHLDSYNIVPLKNKDWYAITQMELNLTGFLLRLDSFLERLQRYENIIVERIELTADETCPMRIDSNDCAMRLSCTLSMVLPKN